MNKIESSDTDELEHNANDPNANCPPDPAKECSIPVVGGWLVFPASNPGDDNPYSCEYVRVVDTTHYERGYWHFNEWAEEPELVMGAIGGLLNELQNESIVDAGDLNDVNHHREIRRTLEKTLDIKEEIIVTQRQTLALQKETSDLKYQTMLFNLMGVAGVIHMIAAGVIGLLTPAEIGPVVVMVGYVLIGAILMLFSHRGLRRLERSIRAKDTQ